MDIVEKGFYGRYVSFDALLECASDYLFTRYKKCTLTLIVCRLFAAVDWLFSGVGFETNELYQPSSYMVAALYLFEWSLLFRVNMEPQIAATLVSS